MRSFRKDEDVGLLAMVIGDPEKGFHHIMAKYGEPVYWHVRRLLVSHEDARDAAQETFVRVFRSLSRFHGECSLRSWIFKIASNEALRMLGRRRENQVSLEDSIDEADGMAADEYVDYSDIEAVKLQQAILTLPHNQQVAFNLRYYDEMGYDEIAEVIGTTPEAAKSSYHVAKNKIIKYMNLK